MLDDVADVFVFLGPIVVAMVRRRRTWPENLLKYPLRERIMGLVGREPGIKLSTLATRLGIGRSSLEHHLYHLERAGLVAGAELGREHAYFAGGATPAAWRRVVLLRRDRINLLAETIRRSPGVVQQDLLRQAGLTRKIGRAYIDQLKQELLIMEVKEARWRRYYPTPTLEATMKPPEAQDAAPPAARIKGPGPRLR